MTDYRVRWEIDVDAESERGAAEDIRARYFKLTNASVYTVRTMDTEPKWKHVDLLFEPEHDTDVWVYTHRTLHRMAAKMVEEGDDLDAVLYMLERPWKYSELLTEIALDDAFDKVSPFKDEEDLSTDPVEEVS